MNPLAALKLRTRRPQFIGTWEWAPRTNRSRVLIENPDSAVLWAQAALLQEAGYDVAVCRGETDEQLCPLLESGTCALVDGADVVVSSTDVSRSRRVLGLLRRREPSVVVVGTTGSLDACRDVFGNAPALEEPVTGGSLLAAVAAACRARRVAAR